MQWRIDFHKEVYKEFEKELIKIKKIKKLKTKSDIYRLRLRTFRVLYAKNNGILRLLVVRVRHRKNAYQNLEMLDKIVENFENKIEQK